MEKAIQFFTVRKNDIEKPREMKVVFTLHIPEVLIERMFSEVDLKNCLEDMKYSLTPLKYQKNVLMLSYSDLCKIESWMKNLSSETVYKFYEQKDYQSYPDAAHEEMLKYFVSYTGLKKDECTDEFRCELLEFLNTDSGAFFFLMDDLYRTGEENVDYFVFMRILETQTNLLFPSLLTRDSG